MSDKVDVKTLAKLARLEVSSEELSRLEQEIPSILAFVETIQKATTDTHPSTNSGLKNVMRPDENPHESGIYTEKLLAAAPSREGDRIAVKQVLKRT